MRLLFLTQAIDTEDPVLSFAHSWVREFSKHFDSIEVICLKQGAYTLPSNVRVHSLGKETGHSRLKYVFRFFSYAWRLRDRYDVILVHQNQEYVLLFGIVWRLMRKRVYLWRNHYVGSILTNVAALLCNKVFSTSSHSYTTRFSKNVLMPVGIDTTVFSPNFSQQKRNALLLFGRIAPSKRLERVLEALDILKSKGLIIETDIYGDPLPKHAQYAEELRRFTKERNLQEYVHFFPGVPNSAAPALYSSHELFVNCSESGMYDKTIFESLASGALTLAASRDYASLVDSRLSFDGSAEGLARALENIVAIPEMLKERLKKEGRATAEAHSLESLGKRLTSEMSG